MSKSNYFRYGLVVGSALNYIRNIMDTTSQVNVTSSANNVGCLVGYSSNSTIIVASYALFSNVVF